MSSGSSAGAGLPPIGVNLLWCVPGEVGGSEQYLVRQLAGALALEPALALTLFATRSFADRYATRLAPAMTVIGPSDGRSRARRIVDESTWLHARTARHGLVHHGGGTAPGRSRRPFLVTIHDLQYLSYPHYVDPVKLRYLRSVVPRSARRAAVVTVPTAYVRDTVVGRLGVPPERVVVVPHGYEPELLVERTPAAELRERLGLGTAPIVVYPAMLAPHKNHRFLVELIGGAWADRDVRLVLLGGHGLAAEAVASAIAASEARRPGRIVHAGRVSDADRNGLIGMADALVFPSTYEGFGAPLIEAMALGTPVLCSDATCLPEVAGDAAVVAPLDPDAWAAGLDEVRERRDELIAAGRRRVAAFTAEASGAALLDAYRTATSVDVATPVAR